MPGEPFDTALLAAASFLAGVMNTVVGSGSLLTFPVLILLGVPPVTANTSNTVGLSVGNAMGVYGYRRELRGLGRLLLPLAVVTAASAVVGALLLLCLPAEVFALVAPALIIAGCLLVVIQPLLRPARGEAGAGYRGVWQRRVAQMLTAVTGCYGGYFGAAQGVLIVGVLGVTTTFDVQKVNALKNVLQTVAGAAAAGVFLFSGAIDWWLMGVIAAASVIGAALGAKVGRMLPPWSFRVAVVAVGGASIFTLLR